MSYRNETLIIRIWLRIRKDHLQMRITQRNYHPSTSMQQMWSYKFLPYYSTPVSWNWFYVSIVLLSYLSVFKILLPCWRRVWSFAMIQCFNLQKWVPTHVLSLKSPGGKGLFVTVWAHAFFNNLFKQSIQNYRMWNEINSNGLRIHCVYTELKGCQNTDTCNNLHLHSMVPTKFSNSQSILW